MATLIRVIPPLADADVLELRSFPVLFDRPVHAHIYELHCPAAPRLPEAGLVGYLLAPPRVGCSVHFYVKHDETMLTLITTPVERMLWAPHTESVYFETENSTYRLSIGATVWVGIAGSVSDGTSQT